MSDHIQAVTGVQALLPTKYTDLGQYKVSVTEKNFKKVREHFQQYLLPWYDMLNWTHTTLNREFLDHQQLQQLMRMITPKMRNHI